MQRVAGHADKSSLPWWTWILPIVLIHLGTEISLWSKVTTGSSLFYFPVPIALILTYWWGLRVLPALFINSTLSAGLFGLDNPLYYPLYVIPETLFVFLSWLFFIRFAKGKVWLPNIRETSLFLLLGIVIPLVLYKFLLEFFFVVTGAISYDKFWTLLTTTSLGDFISIFGLTFPVLYFFSGPMTKRKLTLVQSPIPDRFTHFKDKIIDSKKAIELILIMALVLVMSQLLKFADYWFLYGVISLFVAMRFGFGLVILFNSYILLFTYVIPSVIDSEFTEAMIIDQEMIKIQLGSSLLYIFSTVTGRVMSDAAVLEKRLSKNNEELLRTNNELDRFVYSVSHDLSAPLKSIHGLVIISRLEKSESQIRFYLDKIESSVHKLESFIREILDFSRNERQAISTEEINIEELCNEILDNLKFQDNFSQIRIDLTGIAGVRFVSDKMRLKIILNNLLSNAVKFQRVAVDHIPYIKISARSSSTQWFIDVEDNGEGIRPELKDKIFDMFFRGTQQSNGSGLGLYIAKEAAEKIQGDIKVESVYGKGSVFHLEFKKSEV